MLKLANYSVYLADKKIVNNLNITVKPNTVNVLMGPNGSGKSTLSLSLMGYPSYSVDKLSRFSVNGKDMRLLTPNERARAGLFLSFQQPVSIPGLSVWQLLKVITDNLAFPALTLTQVKLLVKKYALLLKINDELLKRSLNEGFSGGEKKKIEMLQLLITGPKYAVLDEIDSGLDVDAIKVIGKSIMLAKKRFNTGFLVITHYKRVLEYIQADNIWVLTNGQMVASGGQQLMEKIELNGYEEYQQRI